MSPGPVCGLILGSPRDECQGPCSATPLSFDKVNLEIKKILKVNVKRHFIDLTNRKM